MDDRHSELRDHFIAALMEHEHRDYADAERVVREFEVAAICPRCGAVVQDNVAASERANTIWA